MALLDVSVSILLSVSLVLPYVHLFRGIALEILKNKVIVTEVLLDVTLAFLTKI